MQIYERLNINNTVKKVQWTFDSEAENENDLAYVPIEDNHRKKIVSETMECNSDCVKTMDVDHLAQGTYFVRITGDNVNIVQKLIVR